MPVWYLILWSSVVSPFSGGEYQQKEMCEAAAMVQTAALRSEYGGKRLRWRCEMRLQMD